MLEEYSTTYYYMNCDGEACENTFEDDYGFESEGDAVREAKEQGWTKNDEDKWLCPDCQK